MTTPASEHVFDRKPNPRDDRDWKMSDYLGAPSLHDVDTALAEILRHHWIPPTDRVGQRWVAKWAEAVTKYLHALTPAPPPLPPPPTPIPPPPVPIPPPPPPPAVKVWHDDLQLDQGATGHCVGFGWAQWGNTEPVIDTFVDNDAHAIYYEAKVIDGEPRQENGTAVRSGAIAMLHRSKLDAYVFAATLDEILTWVLTRGPVVFGCNWYADMNMPDPTNGLVNPTGPLLGGHCFVIDGYDSGTTMVRCQNSWGSNWGLNGYFYIFAKDLGKLFAQQGDACAAIELPLLA